MIRTMTHSSRRDILALSTIAVLGLATAGFGTALSTAAQAATARVGQPAPAFTATDSDGKTVSLADLKGKTVVLEWTNHDCPFVKKHYSGNMQSLQKKWTDQGVVWLSVISSAPGEQGAVSAAEANKLTADRKAQPSHVLFDPKGDIGKLYGAQTTPHMYVITPTGTLAYMGGIDDKPSTDVADIAKARNYLNEALVDVVAGKPVAVTTSKPYGCSIKYAS